jgi:hypothetical protein
MTIEIDLVKIESEITERLEKEYSSKFEELERNLADKYQGILQDNQRLGKYLVELELKARHWDIIKKTIDENPNTKIAWNNFLMVLRLSQPDFDSNS